jgi:hypothetical protein
VKPPAGRECEHLDESSRLAEPPRPIVDLDSPDADRETSEEVDRDV